MENHNEKAELFILRTRFFIQKGNLDKAWKYAMKLDRLFPTPESQDLLFKLNIQIEKEKKRAQKKFNNKLQEMRKNSKSNSSHETANVVQNLRNSDNYYTMLGTTNTASVRQIKRAYNNLLLLLHVDANLAYCYDELFVDIKKAYDTLCDREKRLVYDISLQPDSTLPMYDCYEPER